MRLLVVALAFSLACKHGAPPADPDPGSVVNNAAVIASAPASVPDRVVPTAEHPIVVDEPERDAKISGSLVVSGRARVFEGHVAVRVVQGGQELVSTSATASAAAPAAGTFSVRLTIPPSATGKATLEVFTRSAATGAPENLVQIPLVIGS